MDHTPQRTIAAGGREEQLRSILATVPDAMVLIDEIGTTISFDAGPDGATIFPFTLPRAEVDHE